MEYESNSSKIASDETKEKIRTIFNDIAQQEDFTPKKLAKNQNTSDLHKKGDSEDAGNYRPICSLPVLYKLFRNSTLWLDLHPDNTKNNLPIRRGLGPTH